jgi:hypothetical protein
MMFSLSLTPFSTIADDKQIISVADDRSAYRY